MCVRYSESGTTHAALLPTEKGEGNLFAAVAGYIRKAVLDRRPVAAAAVLGLVLALVPAYRAQAIGSLEVVSLTSTGQQTGGAYGSLSADGRFLVFDSGSSNVVPNDTNGKADVFLKDWLTGTTELISITTDGQLANGASNNAQVSDDGRYVVFLSAATNLHSNDTNGLQDVFVRDRQLGTTSMVSVTTTGESGDGHSYGAVISGNGRYVAFNSSSTNLVASGASVQQDVYLRDLVTGTTQQISVSSTGSQCNGVAVYPSISSDGRFVTFEASCSNIVPNDTNGVLDVFVRDTLLNTTERISLTSSGQQAFYFSGGEASISADGRYVAFPSQDNLVDNGIFKMDIYVRDRQTGTVERITNGYNGQRANGNSRRPSISSDGRYVVFESSAKNLVSNDGNNYDDVFFYDRKLRTMTRLSMTSTGAETIYASTYPKISANGIYAVFMTPAALNPGDMVGLHLYMAQVSKPIPTVTVDHVTGMYGNPVTLRATLGYEGAVLSGRLLTFEVNGMAVGTGTTDMNGTATLTYVVAEGAGAYPVTVEFAGDDSYQDTASTGTLTVIRQPATITYTGETVATGGPITLGASLQASAGVASNAGSLTFVLSRQGVTVGTHSAPVLSDWTSTVFLPVLPAGPYTVTVSLNENPYFEALPVSAKIRGKALTSPGAQYSDTIMLPATLIGDAPLANQPLSLKVNGLFVGSANTDSNGKVTLPYTVALPAGTYDLVSEFAGNDDWAPTTGSGMVVFNPEVGVLTYAATTSANAGPVTLSARFIQEPDGSPGDTTLGTLRLTVTEQTTGTVYGPWDIQMDADGQAATTQTLAAGTYTISVTLNGNGYFAATGISLPLTVSPAP